jgi:hypothetical protein
VAITNVLGYPDAEVSDCEPKFAARFCYALGRDVAPEIIAPVLERVVAELADRHVQSVAPARQRSRLMVEKINRVLCGFLYIGVDLESPHRQESGFSIRTGGGQLDYVIHKSFGQSEVR